MNGHKLKPGWEMVKFGDVAQNVVERADPSHTDADVYVGLEHLDSDALHLHRWGRPSDVIGEKLVFKTGDIIFGKRRAYQRKLAIAEFDGICSAHAMVLRPKPERVWPDFFPFFLQSDVFMNRAIEISVGSLSPTINWATLRDQEFVLPPIEEQKRIAEVLWAADEAVESLLNTRTCLDSLHETLIDDLVAHHGDSYEFVSLGALAYGQPQYGANASACAHREGAYRYVRITDIGSDGNLSPGEVAGIDLPDEECRKYVLSPGDVLFARTGTVGEVYVHKDQAERCVYAGYLVRFKLNTEKILPEFLFFFTRSRFYREWVRKTVRVGVQPNINGKEYSTLPVLVPPIKYQRALLSESARVMSAKQGVSNSINAIHEIATRLMNAEHAREEPRVQ